MNLEGAKRLNPPGEPASCPLSALPHSDPASRAPGRAPRPWPAGSVRRHHGGARPCAGTVRPKRHRGARRGAAPKSESSETRPLRPPPPPGPAHPSSAMALSVGAAPARVPAANTDRGRPSEWRRPPRGPRPARSRRDARPPAAIRPGRPRRHGGYSPRHRRRPPAKEGAGLPPHALIARQDPGPRGGAVRRAA